MSKGHLRISLTCKRTCKGRPYACVHIKSPINRKTDCYKEELNRRKKTNRQQNGVKLIDLVSSNRDMVSCVVSFHVSF